MGDHLTFADRMLSCGLRTALGGSRVNLQALSERLP